MLRTERALAGLVAGEVLRVVTTDLVAELDMAVISQRSGHELLRLGRLGEELIFCFRRGASASQRG